MALTSLTESSTEQCRVEWVAGLGNIYCSLSSVLLRSSVPAKELKQGGGNNGERGRKKSLCLHIPIIWNCALAKLQLCAARDHGSHVTGAFCILDFALTCWIPFTDFIRFRKRSWVRLNPYTLALFQSKWRLRSSNSSGQRDTFSTPWAALTEWHSGNENELVGLW